VIKTAKNGFQNNTFLIHYCVYPQFIFYLILLDLRSLSDLRPQYTHAPTNAMKPCILTCVVLGFIHPVITIFIHSMWSLGVSMEVVLAAEQFTGLLWQRGHAQPTESTRDRGGLLCLVPVPPKRPRTLVPHHTLLKIRQNGPGQLKTEELSHD